MILKADASAAQRKMNEELASAMPKGKIIHLEGAGHNLHHDKLNQTVQLIERFLAEN